MAYKERIQAYGQEPVIGTPFKQMMDDETAAGGDSDMARRIEHHKTIIVGEKGVGKSSILARYMFHAHEAAQDHIAKR